MAFNKYAEFSGRSTRSEYWYFVLFNFLLQVVLQIVLAFGAYSGKNMGITTTLFGIYALIIFIPSLAVAIRRLHDVGKSGWMLLISFVPLIG